MANFKTQYYIDPTIELPLTPIAKFSLFAKFYKTIFHQNSNIEKYWSADIENWVIAIHILWTNRNGKYWTYNPNLT